MKPNDAALWLAGSEFAERHPLRSDPDALWRDWPQDSQHLDDGAGGEIEIPGRSAISAIVEERP